VDEFVDNTVRFSPDAATLSLRWMASPESLIGRAGWSLQRYRFCDGAPDGPAIAALLARIEAEILTAPKHKQEAINDCLVEIGIYLADWRSACIALGEKLGRFDTTPVPKGCTSSCAPAWIAAVLKRKQKNG
jgi:hypothetical protein